jgi:hypothetical protein
MADLLYPHAKASLLGKAGHTTLDFDTDTFFVMLVTDAYVSGVADATKKTHQFRSSITGEVAAGGGYTTGGQALDGVTVTQVGDNWVVDFSDEVFPAASFTARGAIIYKSTGSAATDALVGLFDFGSDKTASGGNFTVAWNASGVLQQA